MRVRLAAAHLLILAGAWAGLCWPRMALAQCDPQWTLVSTSGPSPRWEAATCYDSDRKRMVLVGGSTEAGFPVNETWEWDGSTWTFMPVGGPGSRAGARMAYDSDRHRAVLFGGPVSLHDTWEYNGIAWTRVATTGPSGRFEAQMAYDPIRHRTVMFGGATYVGTTIVRLGDTWEWDGSSWTEMPVNVPSAGFYGATMAFDEQLGKMVLTGNSHGTQEPTWTYDGTAWTALPTAGPWDAVMSSAYDSDRGLWLVFGLSGGPAAFDGVSWTNASSPGPTHGYGAAMVYDRERRQTVLFGGYDYQSGSNETWILPSFVPVVTSQPQSTSANEGSVVALHGASVNASDTWQWRRNGVPLVDGGAIQGVNQPMLTLDPVTRTMAGRYDVVVANGCSPLTTLSAPADLDVTCVPALAITQQPASVIVDDGGMATFTVQAVGCTVLHYSWRKDLVPIAGAPDAPAYSIPIVGAAQRGAYTVLVTDGVSSVVSDAATLNIAGPVFLTNTVRALSVNQSQISWTLKQPARVVADYGGTIGLGTATAPSPIATSGLVLLDRGGRDQVFYRLTATDAFDQTASTPIAEATFLAAVPVMNVGVVPPVGYTFYTNPSNGIRVGLNVTNIGTGPSSGPVRVIVCTLNGRPPRKSGGQLAIPILVTGSGIQVGQTVHVDMTFSRTEVAASPRSTVTLTGTVRWWETQAANSPYHDVAFSSRVRLP